MEEVWWYGLPTTQEAVKVNRWKKNMTAKSEIEPFLRGVKVHSWGEWAK